VHALIYIGFSIDNQQQVGELDFYHNHEAFHLQVDTDRHKESSLGQEEERECTVNPTFLVLHVFIKAAELHLMLFHPSDCVARDEKQVTESEQEDALEHEEGHCRPFGPYFYAVFRRIENHHVESQGDARL